MIVKMFCALDKEGQKIEAQSTSLSSIAKALLQDFCHDLNYSKCLPSTPGTH